MFHETNIVKFLAKLTDVDLDAFLDPTSAKTSFSKFYSSFTQLYNDCFPFKTLTIYEAKLKYLTPGLKKSLAIKNALYAKQVRRPTLANIAYITKSINEYLGD